MVVHNILFVVFLLCNLIPVALNGRCEQDKESQRIQVMLLIDQTTSYSRFQDKLSLAFLRAQHSVNKLHPNAEFAISLFGNWEALAGVAGEQDHPDSCYKLEQAMTSSVEKVKQKLQGLQPLGGVDKENAIGSLAFAGADQNAGWVRLDKDMTNKEVRRFIVLMTDTDNKVTLSSNKGRKDFVGDGTDTCSSSLNPSYFTVRKLLKKNNFNVIGFYSNETVMGNFDNEFWSLGIPYCAGHFNDEAPTFVESFDNTIIKCMTDVLRCVRS